VWNKCYRILITVGNKPNLNNYNSLKIYRKKPFLGEIFMNSNSVTGVEVKQE